MPVCFAMYRKDDVLCQEKLGFFQIDKEIAEYFGQQTDPVRWFREWYNMEGFCIAMGKSWEQIAEMYPERVDIQKFLQDNYRFDNWRE